MSAIPKIKNKRAADNWKARYQQALNELNKKGKAWAGTENRLYKSILRLIFTYNGLDTKLDSELTSMRNTLRKGADNRTREKLTDNIIGLIIEYAQKRGAGKSGTVLLIEQLSHLIDKLILPKLYTRELDKVNRSLARTNDEKSLKICCDQLVTLINNACKPDTDKEPDLVEIKQEDLFDKFLQNLSLPGEIGSGIISLRKKSEQLTEEQQRLELAEELIDLFKRMYSSSVTTEPDSQAIDFTQLKEVLFQLIEWLPLPQQSNDRVEEIKNRLTDLNDKVGLKNILREIALIISELQSGLQNELRHVEDFLENITLRLTELETHIHDISSGDIESTDNTINLNESLQNNVRSIREDIDQANKIEDIKKSINRRLIAIENSMETFLDTEKKRIMISEQRVKKLNKQIIRMKVEAYDLHKRVEDEQSRAQVDALTRLANRLAYDERIQQEFNRWQRYNKPLTICIIDIDKFKNVNDKYGHKVGDKVLRTVAELCDSRVRETDFLARYGGEEFVLLLPETPLEQSITLADNLRKEVEKCNFHYAKDPVAITISCGLAEFKQGDTPDSVFVRADKALYAAKQGGRNQCKNEHQL